MTEKTDIPQATKEKSRSVSAREDRLKAALKANMARRKAQTKARADQISDTDSDNSDFDNNN